METIKYSWILAAICLSLVSCKESPDATTSNKQSKQVESAGAAKNADASSTATPSKTQPAGTQTPGVGDLRLGMPWKEAEKTKLLANATVTTDPMDGAKVIPFRELTEGKWCVIVAFGTQILRCDSTTYRSKPVSYEEHVKLPTFVIPVTVKILGQDRRIEISVAEARVTAISVDFGAFQQAVSEQVLEQLQKNYGQYAPPSNAEVDDFNNKRSSCLAWARHDFQAAWTVTWQRALRFDGRPGDPYPQAKLIYGESLVKETCVPRTIAKPSGPKL